MVGGKTKGINDVGLGQASGFAPGGRLVTKERRIFSPHVHEKPRDVLLIGSFVCHSALTGVAIAHEAGDAQVLIQSIANATDAGNMAPFVDACSHFLHSSFTLPAKLGSEWAAFDHPGPSGSQQFSPVYRASRDAHPDFVHTQTWWL